MAGIIKFSGNKVKCKQILAQANQLKNFMIGQLKITGLLTSTRRVKLSDGSIISIRIYTDSIYNNINSVISIYGAGGTLTITEFFPLVCYQDEEGLVVPGSSPRFKKGLKGFNKSLDPVQLREHKAGQSGYWYSDTDTCSWYSSTLYSGVYTCTAQSLIRFAAIIGGTAYIVYPTSLVMASINKDKTNNTITLATIASSPLPGFPQSGSFSVTCESLSYIDFQGNLQIYTINKENYSITFKSAVVALPFRVSRVATSNYTMAVPLPYGAFDDYYNFIFTYDTTANLKDVDSGSYYKVTYNPEEIVFYRRVFKSYTEHTKYYEKVTSNEVWKEYLSGGKPRARVISSTNPEFYQKWEITATKAVTIEATKVDKYGNYTIIPYDSMVNSGIYEVKMDSKQTDGRYSLSIVPNLWDIKTSTAYSESAILPLFISTGSGKDSTFTSFNSVSSTSTSSTIDKGVPSGLVKIGREYAPPGRIVLLPEGEVATATSNYTFAGGGLASFGTFRFFDPPYAPYTTNTSNTSITSDSNISTNIDEIMLCEDSRQLSSTTASTIQRQALLNAPESLFYSTSQSSPLVTFISSIPTNFSTYSCNSKLLCLTTRDIFINGVNPDYTINVVNLEDGSYIHEVISPPTYPTPYPQYWASITNK